MSLDEIKQQIEDKKRIEAEKTQKNIDRKKKSKKISSNKQEIKVTFGNNVQLSINQQHLDEIFKKIWNLDLIANSELDSSVAYQFSKHFIHQKIPIDKYQVFHKIREEAYFKLTNDLIIPYFELRAHWFEYSDPKYNLKFSGSRKEFVQLLTNRYKNRWVNKEGNVISEDVYQVLYRLEREPKSLERIFEFMEENYFNFIKEQAMNEFLVELRTTLGKIIKDDFLDFINSHSEKIDKKN